MTYRHNTAFPDSAFRQDSRKENTQKQWQRRRRKPKRQGSRDQRGKRLPERQRHSRPFWSHQPHRRGKDG